MSTNTEIKPDGTPRLTITDEKGNSYIMAETYAELMKAYDFYHKEKERQRAKAKKNYIPRPRAVKQPAQVVQVAVASEPVATVAPTPKPRPTRRVLVKATPLEEKVASMDI